MTKQDASRSEGGERPRLVVVGGFLGAGKTSLILALGQALLNQGRRVVVLENEAGKVGLDNQYLADQGLRVSRMLGGCACCDLQPIMLARLEELAQERAADDLLFEPSGAASLGGLLATLHQHAPVESLAMVAVVDATRLAVMLKAMRPLVEGQLAAAPLVVIAKADLVDAAALAAVEAEVRARNPRALIWAANLLGDEAPGLAAELAQALTAGAALPPLMPEAAPAYWSRSWELTPPEGSLAQEKAIGLVAEVLTRVGRSQAAGLAHVKLLGEDDQGRSLFVSGTGAADVSVRGTGQGGLTGVSRLVVVLLGAEPQGLTAQVEELLERAVGAQGYARREEEEHHHHHHHH